ncbi:hypothetical protein G7046_g4722 [Stylonectria norvegica]|nr:hypothetical protein G7046_g4722 [Stylonectria norvegica]
MFSQFLLLALSVATLTSSESILRRTVTQLDGAAFEEAQQRDSTATRAFANVKIKTSTGKCLFVDKLSGDFRANLTPVQIADCDSTDGQGWDIITAGKHNDQEGQMLVVNTLTQACLNFDPRRPAGNQVLLFSCGGRADGGGDVTNSQLFADAKSETQSLTPQNGDGLCLTSSGGKVIDVVSCDGGADDQKFTFGNVANSNRPTQASVATSNLGTSTAPSSTGSSSKCSGRIITVTNYNTVTASSAMTRSLESTASGTGLASDESTSATTITASDIPSSNPTTPIPVSRAGGTLNPSAAAEANEFDATATRVIESANIRAPDGRCLLVDPTAGDFRQNLIPVQLVACGEDANQKFDVVTKGKHNDGKAGEALIVSVLTDGCLSFDARRSAGDTVTMFSCGGRAAGDGQTDSAQLYPFNASVSRRATRLSTTPPAIRYRGPPRNELLPDPTPATTRAQTFMTVDDYDEFDTAFSARPGWQPGSEPGYDPMLPDGGHASVPTLSAPCEITVIDFSQDNMVKRHFDNETFVNFIEGPKESWAKCRWININGLSWDVIQAVGNKKGLHKLALEDLMNIRNRTKADWYPNHAFIVMTLQKLVHMVDDDNSSSDSESTASKKSLRTMANNVKNFWNGRRPPGDLEKEMMGDKHPNKTNLGAELHETAILRTLQQYHASGNEARTEYMERHSSLAPYKMAVSAEQVSIFLTSDNTVISFFEVSAGDVERPIVTRLSTPGTILRESNDASLLVQAIIDAIIDLAIPLTAVYTDIISDLELDVLTSPSMNQSRSLYICISEINKMLSFLNPIDNLVNVLRDHKTYLTHEQALLELENPGSGVIVTPMTHTYLGDVLDHCIIITEAMQQLKQSSDNLINLIFNTLSANQNESMKQLTIVTIIFLPLTFITGYFGQNIKDFPDLDHGIWYFWACAVPTVFATIFFLMREMIWHWLVRLVRKKQIGSMRKKKRARKL